MAPKKKDVPTGPLGIAGSAAVAVLALAGWALMASGLPLDIYKWKGDFNNGGCYSVWGHKECGAGHPSAHADEMIKTCGVIEASLKAAASMAIVSFLGYFLTILFAILYTLRLLTNKVPWLIVVFFTLLTSCVPWTVVCGLYENSTCGYPSFKYVSSYGSAFTLFIVAFCCSGVNVILTILS